LSPPNKSTENKTNQKPLLITSIFFSTLETITRHRYATETVIENANQQQSMPWVYFTHKEINKTVSMNKILLSHHKTDVNHGDEEDSTPRCLHTQHLYANASV
jgi:hypothetical protein